MNGITTEVADARDMEALASGRDEALDPLMQRHGVRILRYLSRLLRDAGEAEEAAQEVFVRVYQHRGRYVAGQRFTSWLYAIATNVARDRLRRWRRRASLLAEEAADDSRGTEAADPALSPGEALEEREVIGMVRGAVEALPEDLRVAMVLAEYEGLTHAEIGQAMDCSAKAVEMRLYRARQLLRRDLGRFLTSGGGAVASRTSG